MLLVVVRLLVARQHVNPPAVAEEAERHLDEGVTLARRIGRPFLEFSGLVYQAGIELFRSSTRAAGLAGDGGTGSSPRLAEPLSHSELRMLRYLSAPEIAGELGA